LEAADWYDQRVDAATDQGLKDILAHNRDEEKEHFAMLLEWYRRRDAKMDAHLKEYLFTTGSLISLEQANTGGGGGGGGETSGAASLGIGSLKGGQGRSTIPSESSPPSPPRRGRRPTPKPRASSS